MAILGLPALATAVLLIATYLGYAFLAFLALWTKLRKLDPKGASPKIMMVCPTGALAKLTPTEWTWFSLGGMWTLYKRRQPYKEYGWNAFTTIALFPPGSSTTFVGDGEVIRGIVNDRVKFPKPLESYKVLQFFGLSVLTTEGNEWKKHRRLSQPAFSERNNRLVWEAATGIIEELINEVWENKKEVYVDHCLTITVPIALMVLSVAAFGKPMSWKTGFLPSSSDSTGNTRAKDKENIGLSGPLSAEDMKRGHTQTFTYALYMISTHLVGALAVPSWCMLFTKKLREIRRSFKELELYMDEFIAERKAEFEDDPEGNAKRGDLLTNLIIAAAAAESSDDEEGGTRPRITANGKKDLSLSETDLRGNVFIYFIAGHETVGHTLTYILGLLAIHPEEQERLYQETMEVLGGRDSADYDDFPKFTRALAILYESLRMFPPVPAIPKHTTETTVFNVSSTDTGNLKTREMVIPAKVHVYLHANSVHFDERYYPDPYTFQPDRFLTNSWNKDMFLAFSSGARACIGRKFAEVEVVAALTALVKRYKVRLTKEMEAEFDGLELGVWERVEKLLDSKVLLSSTPVHVPLVFEARE